MSVIHFKFKNRQDYEKVAISGLEVSGKELKEAIMKNKKIGHSNLEIRDAQTKKVYSDTDMIKRNASVVVMRSVIPNAAKLPKTQHKDPSLLPSAGLDPQTFGSDANDPQKTSDLTTLLSEDDRLEAMMKQSGEGYTAADYARYPVRPGVHPGFYRGPPPRGYVCNRCRKPGHWIQLCPTNGDPAYDKRNKQELLAKTSTAGGSAKTKHSALAPKEKEIPEDLKCPICKQPMRDAVVIPCCNKSFCDECIREHLLDKDFTCPVCEAEDVSPDSLKPNKQLREAVKQFRSQVAEEKGIAVASLFSRAGLTPHELSASHISKPQLTPSAALLERLTASRPTLPPSSSSSSSLTQSATSSVTADKTNASTAASVTTDTSLKSSAAGTTDTTAESASSSNPATVDEVTSGVKGQTDDTPDKVKTNGEEGSSSVDKTSSDSASLAVPEPVGHRSPSPSSSPRPSRSKSPSPLDVRRPTQPIDPVRRPPPPRHPKHPLSSLLHPRLPLMTGFSHPTAALLQYQNQVAVAAAAGLPAQPNIMNSVPGLGVIQTAPPLSVKDYRAEAEFLLSQKRPRPASPPPLTIEEFYRQQKFLHQFIEHRSPAHSTGQGSAYSHSSGSESDISESYTSSGSGSETDESALSRTPSPEREKRHRMKHHHKKKQGKESLVPSSKEKGREKEGERGRHKKRKRDDLEDSEHRQPKTKRHRHHKKGGKSAMGDASADQLNVSSDAAATTDSTAHRRHRHHRHRHQKKGRRHRHRNTRDEAAGDEGERVSDGGVEVNHVMDGEGEAEGENAENDLPEGERGGVNDITDGVENGSVPMSGSGEGSPVVAGAPVIMTNDTTESVDNQVKGDTVSGSTESVGGKVAVGEESAREVEAMEASDNIEAKSLGGDVVDRRGSCDQLLDDIDELLADEKTPTLEASFKLIPTVAGDVLPGRGEEKEPEGRREEEAPVPGEEEEEVELPANGSPSDMKEGEGSQGVVEVEEEEEENLSLHTEETIDPDMDYEDTGRPSSNGLEEGEVLSDTEQLPGGVVGAVGTANQPKPRLRSVASTVQAVNSETPDLTPSPSEVVSGEDGDTPSEPSPPPSPPPHPPTPPSLTVEEPRLVKPKHKHHHRHHRDKERNDHGEGSRAKKKRRTKDKSEKSVSSSSGHHRYKPRKRDKEEERKRHKRHNHSRKKHRQASS